VSVTQLVTYLNEPRTIQGRDNEKRNEAILDQASQRLKPRNEGHSEQKIVQAWPPGPSRGSNVRR
jgi:hypothetical protein